MIEILSQSTRISIDSSLRRMIYVMSYAPQNRVEGTSHAIYESPELRKTLNSKLDEECHNLEEAILVGKTKNSFKEYKLCLKQIKFKKK